MVVKASLFGRLDLTTARIACVARCPSDVDHTVRMMMLPSDIKCYRLDSLPLKHEDNKVQGIIQYNEE